jgi:hypothetical protein
MSMTSSPSPGQLNRGPQEATEPVAGFVHGGHLSGRESVEQPDLHAQPPRTRPPTRTTLERMLPNEKSAGSRSIGGQTRRSSVAD